MYSSKMWVPSAIPATIIWVHIVWMIVSGISVVPRVIETVVPTVVVPRIIETVVPTIIVPWIIESTVPSVIIPRVVKASVVPRSIPVAPWVVVASIAPRTRVVIVIRRMAPIIRISAVRVEVGNRYQSALWNAGAINRSAIDVNRRILCRRYKVLCFLLA